MNVNPMNESVNEPGAALLNIERLDVVFGEGRPAVCGASVEVAAGEVVAIVGESGSGKSLTARAVLGLLPDGARVAGGDIRFEGRSMAGLTPAQWREVRGARIGMVFQEPLVSLNPALRIGDQMAEALRLHTRLGEREIRERCIEMLRRVKVADPLRCLQAYPHEFSGGMRQRIMLASVMLPRPRLLIADEPTTALDMLVQREVLDLMGELTQASGTAVLMISHDLALVAERATRVVVMQAGRVIESGRTEDILLRPREAYTRRLLDALPSRQPARSLPTSRPVVETSHLRVSFAGPRQWFRKAAPVDAVKGVSLALHAHETLAVVGESGSGKTTVARVLTQLARPSGGSLLFEGEDVATFDRARRMRFQRAVQMVFQDPYSSLDPRMRLVDIVAEPLRHDRRLDAAERRRRALALLQEAGLPAELADRLPHQISGGQRQRVAIARAVIPGPQVVVADEPVSALDATVQKQVLDLLRQLQARHGFACLFVSHDLGVVESIADRVAVMHRGHVVELAPRDALFDRPAHPYTRALLAAAPRLEPLGDAGFRLRHRQMIGPQAIEGREWFDAGVPVAGAPEMVEVGEGHWVACVREPGAAAVTARLTLVPRAA